MTGTAMTVRIDPDIKNKAAEYLKQMGLTTSEATRLFYIVLYFTKVFLLSFAFLMKKQ
nr:type II toxin-antitoxin system RelB/DinJ family antitoxin [Sulfurospirillum diekertiae]